MLAVWRKAHLEEDGLSVHPPEVSNGVTTVTSTRQQLQSSVAVWTQLLWNRVWSGQRGLHACAVQVGLQSFLLCCFCRALSQMAGRSCSLHPSVSVQPREQTTTPKQDFFRIWQLWLLVFLMAQPDRCLWAFLSSAATSKQNQNTVVYKSTCVMSSGTGSQ